LSTLSTNIEASPWPELESQVTERLEKYKYADRDLLKSCLQSCMSWFPIDGRQRLARHILDADNDRSLYAIYKALLTGLFIPSTYQEPYTFVDFITKPSTNDPDHTASRDHAAQARYESFRDTLLKRNDHRCVVSDFLDIEQCDKMGYTTDVPSAELEAVCIIHFAYGPYRSKCFSGVRQTGLSTERIYSPENGLSLELTLRKAFSKFSIAFKATGVENQYELKAFRRLDYVQRMLVPKSRIITFKQAKGCKNIPLPDARLLECHYRIAEIMNATGIAKVLDRHYNDWDSLRQGPDAQELEEDSSTDIGKYLQTALW
ncbi:hypothetical protein BO78DRAFT_289558, partial [Aspergillus sclerotiicarbonarius CBS 121057]